MLAIGFYTIINDLVLYWRTRGEGNDYILIYVDDLLIFIPAHLNSLSAIKEALSKEFEMKDMGELKSFLSIKVTWNYMKYTVMLSQKRYINIILEQFEFIEAAPIRMLIVEQKMERLTTKGNPKQFNLQEEDYK